MQLPSRTVLAVPVAALLLSIASAPASAGGPPVGFAIPLPGHPPAGSLCLGDQALRHDLEGAGWRGVHIGDQISHFHVVAFAHWSRSRRLYQMLVDRCSGSITHVQPVAYRTLPFSGDYVPRDDQPGRRIGFGTGD